MNLPQGYWPHEVPRDYTGQVWIESQMRAHAVAAMLAEREACALEAEHWQKISTTPGHACGQYIAAAIRST